MKKILLFLGAALFLVACGGNGNGNTDKGTSLALDSISDSVSVKVGNSTINTGATIVYPADIELIKNDLQELLKKIGEDDVLENDELIQKLDAFHEDYVNKNELEQVETFDIDKRAIQMKLKDFKSIIKLDDKFDIVVHKDTENLIRGKDEATGLDYYQLFFKIES